MIKTLRWRETERKRWTWTYIGWVLSLRRRVESATVADLLLTRGSTACWAREAGSTSTGEVVKWRCGGGGVRLRVRVSGWPGESDGSGDWCVCFILGDLGLGRVGWQGCGRGLLACYWAAQPVTSRARLRALGSGETSRLNRLFG